MLSPRGTWSDQSAIIRTCNQPAVLTSRCVNQRGAGQLKDSLLRDIPVLIFRSHQWCSWTKFRKNTCFGRLDDISVKSTDSGIHGLHFDELNISDNCAKNFASLSGLFGFPQSVTFTGVCGVNVKPDFGALFISIFRISLYASLYVCQ